MAEGAQRERWNHTAQIVCLLANVHRDPKKSSAYEPKDFHPFHAKKSEPLKGDWSMLRAAFVKPTPDKKG